MNKKNTVATILVCIVLLIFAGTAIFLAGFDWHDSKIFGGFAEPWHEIEIEKGIEEVLEPQDWDYFNDTVFVGDSITYGIAAYNYLSFDHVFAKIGLHQGTALTSKCVYTSKTTSYSISDSLKKAQPGKVIVMLGINAIYSYKADSFYDNYIALLNKIKAATPNSKIIIQSVLPVTRTWATNNGKPNCNEAIAYVNEKLSQIAKDNGCYFLYTYEAFVDSNGFLLSQFSGDGIHLSRKGYENFFNYILTHPIKSSGEFTEIGAVRPPVVYNPASSTVTLPSFESTSSKGSSSKDQSSSQASTSSKKSDSEDEDKNSSSSSQASSDSDSTSSKNEEHEDKEPSKPEINTSSEASSDSSERKRNKK